VARATVGGTACAAKPVGGASIVPAVATSASNAARAERAVGAWDGVVLMTGSSVGLVAQTA
jgi:hypothetical protein